MSLPRSPLVPEHGPSSEFSLVVPIDEICPETVYFGKQGYYYAEAQRPSCEA